MKYNRWILLSLIALTTTIVKPTPMPACDQPENSWQNMAQSYVPAMVTSTLVGITTSSLMKLIEKNYPITTHSFICYMILWMSEVELRTNIINALQADFNAYSMKYKKELMHPTARIASWITYLSIHHTT